MKPNWPTKKSRGLIQKSKPLKVILKELWGFSAPILYLLFWIVILKLAKEWLGDDILDNNLFLVITLVIIFMGIISKSTSWSIGGEKGIKGDSTSKKAEFCVDGVCTIKVSDNEPDVKEKLVSEMGKTVIDIVKNTKGKSDE